MDMFQRRTTFGGGFNASSTKVQFAGFKAGLGFNTMNLSYQQQIARIHDLDGDGGNVYLVAGHPSGTANVNKIIGPRSLSSAFYSRYGDVCRASENNLTLHTETNCLSSSGGTSTSSGKLRLVLEGVLLQGVSLAFNSENPVSNQSMGMSFIALDWTEN